MVRDQALHLASRRFQVGSFNRLARRQNPMASRRECLALGSRLSLKARMELIK
jgi:hypothetical protein